MGAAKARFMTIVVGFTLKHGSVKIYPKYTTYLQISSTQQAASPLSHTNYFYLGCQQRRYRSRKFGIFCQIENRWWGKIFHLRLYEGQNNESPYTCNCCCRSLGFDSAESPLPTCILKIKTLTSVPYRFHPQQTARRVKIKGFNNSKGLGAELVK